MHEIIVLDGNNTNCKPEKTPIPYCPRQPYSFALMPCTTLVVNIQGLLGPSIMTRHLAVGT